jgi:CubicO group peptidase (beta-lactamase class C family)
MRTFRHRAAVVSTALLVVTTGFASAGAHASTRSLSAGGGGVPTTRTDRSRFKNCPEPPAGSQWERAAPAEVGLDAAALRQAADYYRDQLQGTLRVYRFGCLVQTGAFDPLTERVPINMFSTTKFVMTLVAGRAVALGKLRLDDTIGRYFPDRGDAAHRAVTVRQLLTHTTGVMRNTVMEVDDDIPDAVDHFMNLPFAHRPGTTWDYSQVSCTVVAAIIEKAVGKPFQEFAQQELFDPIGIVDGTWFWKTDRSGWTYGYSGLYLRPVDMVRFGQLALGRGVYRGRRLIDEAFIDVMGTGIDQNPGFGLNTWVNAASHWIGLEINRRREELRPLIASAPHDMTMAWGWRGRHIFVMPNLGLVVTATPVALEAPTPGSFFDGYPGHAPGAGPGAGGQYDGRQIGQGETNAGYHELFRHLMRAVNDQKIGDPGPWDQPDDNAFDTEPYVNAPEKAVNENQFGDADYHGWPRYSDAPAVYVKALQTP